MKLIQSLLALGLLVPTTWAADNQLTEAEMKDGWVLLFDGRTLDGWMTSGEKPSLHPVEEHCINPTAVADT